MDVSPCLGAGSTNGQASIGVVYDARGNGNGEVCPTLTGDHQERVSDYTAIAITPKTLKIRSGCEGGGKGALVQDDLSATLAAHNDRTLFQPYTDRYAVRRLTPTECGRLQGFPDGWCDGVPHSDSAEYRLWGNSLAVPCAYTVLAGIAEAFYRANKPGGDAGERKESDTE
jgi:DNA (cytosine-5)-methyltransferase 1